MRSVGAGRGDADGGDGGDCDDGVGVVTTMESEHDDDFIQ